MTSAEKIRAAVDRAEQVADDPTAPAAVRAAAGFLPLFRGQLEQLLPADPGQLDQMLEQGARWFLSLRSDDQPAIALVTTGEVTVGEAQA